MYATHVRRHRDSAVAYARRSKTSVKSRTSIESSADPQRKASTASYPTTLPEVPRRSTPLRIFTSIEEKITLENAVRILKIHYRKHAAEMTLDLFTEHEDLIESFRLKDGSLDLHGLHTHMLFVLEYLEQCIRFDLCSHKLLRSIQRKHLEMSVSDVQIQIMADVIKQYWRKIHAAHVSETYIVALNNLFDRVFVK